MTLPHIQRTKKDKISIPIIHFKLIQLMPLFSIYLSYKILLNTRDKIMPSIILTVKKLSKSLVIISLLTKTLPLYQISLFQIKVLYLTSIFQWILHNGWNIILNVKLTMLSLIITIFLMGWNNTQIFLCLL